jgi:guanidinopropionase
MRGTSYNKEDIDYGREKGVHIIEIEECMARGWTSVMEEARAVVGDAPSYVSFDIDFVDPAYAPGTGTPEVGGPTSFEALQCVRALRGLDIIGTDLVEVSPPFDPSGGTCWLGVSVMFELICARWSGSRRALPPASGSPSSFLLRHEEDASGTRISVR